MKNVKSIVILAFAAALALLAGCGGGQVVELSSLQKRGDVYVVPETQKPYSGKFVVTSRKNEVLQAGSLKNGKLHGELTTYDTFLGLATIGSHKIETYANGMLNGKLKKYDANGKLRLVENYKDGQRVGKVEYYDENGELGPEQRGSFSDQRDGKTYKTVKIGSESWMTETVKIGLGYQKNWMAENLNYEAEGSKCYENNPANCQKYGRLYDWQTALKSCPSGWHLPNNDELQKLVDIAGGKEVAGATLKAASGWNRSGNGTDDYKFSALPGGSCHSDGSFHDVGEDGGWWSASEYNSDHAYHQLMGSSGDRAGLSSFLGKSSLLSVRCVQD